MEPKDPSNSTLRYWEDRNITASEVNWTSMEVKVKRGLKPKSPDLGFRGMKPCSVRTTSFCSGAPAALCNHHMNF